MSNQSIIEHKANMYYVEFREDYLLLCLNCTYKKPVKDGYKCKASPYCKALILAILESWTNDKRGKGQELAIYMTYPQWIAAMYGMFGRNVVIDSLEELLGEKLVSKEAFRLHGKDTFKYLLNCKEINKRMRSLEDRSPNSTHPQVNAFTNKRDAFTSKPDTHLQVNPNPFTSKHNIESTNQPITEPTQEDTDSALHSQAHPSLSTSTALVQPHPEHSFLWFDDLLAPSLMVVRLTPNFPSRYWSEMEDKRRQGIVGEVMSYLQQRGMNVTIKWEYETEQEIEQILNGNEKRSQGDGNGQPSNHHSAPSASVPRDSFVSALSQQFSTEEIDIPPTSQPAQEDALPQVPAIAPQSPTAPLTAENASMNGTLPKIEAQRETETLPPSKQASYSLNKATNAKAVTKPAKETPSGPPPLPPVEMEWCTRKCLLKFDFKRGAPLIVKYQMQQASAIAKGMAENYSEFDVDRVTVAMDGDPFYAGRGGVDIFDVGRNIAKYLKMLNQQEAAKHIVKTGTDMEEAKARAEAKNKEQLAKLRERQAKMQARKGA